METAKESVMKSERRPKSPTRYPKRMPAYVVAFAVQETHDDPQKLQVITNKQSIEKTPSVKSMSPTGSINSTKTFTITPTEKLSTVLDIATISEVKIDIIDENQCGDVEKKAPPINSYIVIDNRTADEQPQIIFNASKHIKICRENNKFPRKKLRKNKRIIKFKNIHFKYKKPKISITKRLEKYYEKTKMNSSNTEKILDQIYCNVLSKVVSRSRVLKKAWAKVNLLDDSDRISCNDGLSTYGYDNDSLNSSPSTTKESFISNTSQNTLVRKCSSSSRNDDFNSMKTVNSIIQVTSEKQIPFKSDVINVSLATAQASAFNASEMNDVDKISMCKENFTSAETFIQNNVTELTSKPSSNEDIKNFNIDYDELSQTNLKEKDSSYETLTNKITSVVEGYSTDDSDAKHVKYLKKNISLLNDLALNTKNKEIDEAKRRSFANDKNKYPTDLGEMWERLSIVLDLAVKRLEENLGDRIENGIKASLAMFNQPECQASPVDIQQGETIVASVTHCERSIPIMLHKEVFVLEELLERDVDTFVQCDLVQKQVIDQLMLKLSIEAPKPIPISTEPLKVLKPPEIVRDYLKILKPPVTLAKDSVFLEVGKDDTVTVSTATAVISATAVLPSVTGWNRLKVLFSSTMAFLRENMVVLTSVPTFFIVLFFLYGVIVNLMKTNTL